MEYSDPKRHWNAPFATPETNKFLEKTPRAPLGEDVSFGVHLTNTCIHHHARHGFQTFWSKPILIPQYTGKHWFHYFDLANYLDSWKCVANLKGDGSSKDIEKQRTTSGSFGSSAGTSSESSNTARYLKMGNVAHPSHVVWH